MGSLRADSTGPTSVQHSSSPTPSLPPSNDDIEAVIQMATSARPTPDGRGGPLRDTRTQLFVGNLPYRVRWQDLKDLFRKAGTVLRADVSLGPDNRSRGYGTVLLASAEDAGRAVDMFNGYSWQTRILEVRLDRLPPDFDNQSPPGGFTLGVPNLQNSQGATPFAPASQNVSLVSAGILPNTAGEDFDYTVFHLYDGLGPSGGGGRNLFVGNLPFHCQWQDLKDLFRQAGTIIRADVALGPDGRSRGFGTVVFGTDFDAERAVKMFNGYEYNGRLLKVHYDKFSQPSQSTTAATSPMPHSAFHHNASFGSHLINPPNHIPLPVGYHFDLTNLSGSSSPYGGPPSVSMAQPHPSQMHAVSVDQLSVSLASTILSGKESSSDESQTLLQSPIQQHQSNSNHPHPGPISIPPPLNVNTFPMPAPHTLSPHAVSPLQHPMSPMQHHHHHLMTPHGLPPITPSMPSFSFLPQPSPNGHPSAASNSMHNLGTSPTHAAQVLSTFSPGVAMSPGAFWGRPGGGVNPFINPAVGAPVHGSPGGFFSMNMHPASPGDHTDEPAGYFPPVPEGGYFPPMGSSNLANEILRDKSGDDETSRSGSSGATDMGTRNSERQTSNLTAASRYMATEGIQGKEGCDIQDKETWSSFLADDDKGVNLINGAHGITRTSSMSASGKSADRIPMNRGTSDPVHARSGDDGRSSADDTDVKDESGRKTSGSVALDLGAANTDS